MLFGLDGDQALLKGLLALEVVGHELCAVPTILILVAATSSSQLSRRKRRVLFLDSFSFFELIL